VKGIAIYVEGGGHTASGRAHLRTGFNALLIHQRDTVRARNLGWRLVPCGGRNETFNAFLHATRTTADEIIVLLVDAEEPVSATTPAGRVAHLQKAGCDLSSVVPERVHLMIQCMEAWIVADSEVLKSYC
jgi:hypothetical protein